MPRPTASPICSRWCRFAGFAIGGGDANGSSGRQDRNVGRDRRHPGGLHAAAQDGAGIGAAGAHRVGLCRWAEQQGGGGARTGNPANRREVAPALCRARPRRAARRAAAWGAPQNRRLKVESVIVQTLESRPPGATHWSTRSMARRSGISTSSVGRIWRAFGLQPHRLETFKLSTDPLFVTKVRDIVGLYLNPPDHALVLCVDEKSQIQALDRSQPLL